MQPWLKSNFGNPSAIHQEGAKAKRAIEDARLQCARTMGIRPNEIFFTGSGTEANNLAIYGYIRSLVEADDEFSDIEIITTKLEHPSVTNVLNHLEDYGVTVHKVPVTEEGLIDVNKLKELLNKKTKLVTVALVNSEIGTIQPLKKITRLVKKFNHENGTKVKVHTDAAQAPLWLSCDLHRLGVDMMTLDAGKFCGPKGVGIFAKLASTPVKGVILGGGQEEGLRGGTENVAGIVGCAGAFVEAQKNYQKVSEIVSRVRDEGIKILLDSDERVVVNGSQGENRVANNINISLPGIDTEYLAVWLDKKGFAVSTKSACSGAGGGESAVVKEISDDPARASSTLRLTLGPDTKIKDIKTLAKEIKNHLTLMSKLTQK